MSNFDKRLTKLEQQTGIEKTYLITGDDSGNVHIQRTLTRIHDEHYIMSESDYSQWQASHPANVHVIEIVLMVHASSVMVIRDVCPMCFMCQIDIVKFRM